MFALSDLVEPRLLLCALPLALSLSACGEEDSVTAVTTHHEDPLMDAALADQIMVDPDMVNRNSANLVASFPTQEGIIPAPDAGSAAIMAAREEAIAMLGGAAALRDAPQPERIDGTLPPEAALSVAARAASAGEGMEDCAALAEFSAVWAARLPEVFPVYPRGAVHEAAGTDEGDCSLRVVNFTTPVPLGDVMDFYFTRADAAGYEVQRVLQDGDDILGGTHGAASVMVFARLRDDGMTDIDLVTSGGI